MAVVLHVRRGALPLLLALARYGFVRS